MSWTDDTNDNTEQEENLITLGLMDVENELRKEQQARIGLKKRAERAIREYEQRTARE